MSDPTSKPMPWSVKGVSDEAREIAKKAAAEHGMTIGDWLSTVIRVRTSPEDSPEESADGADSTMALDDDDLLWVDVDDDEASEEDATGRKEAAASGAEGSDAAAFEDAVRDAVSRSVAASEARVLQIVGTLNDVVSRMADRLEVLEDRLSEREAPPAGPAIDAHDETARSPQQGVPVAAHADQADDDEHGAVIEESTWSRRVAEEDAPLSYGRESVGWTAAPPVQEPATPTADTDRVSAAEAETQEVHSGGTLPEGSPEAAAPAGRWGRRHMRDPGGRP